MQKIVIAVSLFFFSVLFLSCTKETIHETNEIKLVKDTTGGTGTISGSFSYFPTYGYFTHFIKGASISIENTNIKAVTDTNGYFTLENVPSGTYTISFHKDSFGTIKVFNYCFLGRGQAFIQPVYTYQKPVYTFSGLKDSLVQGFTQTGDTIYAFKGNIKILHLDSAVSIKALIAFGLSPDFSINDALKLPYGILNLSGVKDSSPVGYFLTNTIYFLNQNNIHYHGVKIYVKIYPYPIFMNNFYYTSDYTDPIKGDQFTSLGEPVTSQFIIP